MAFRKYTCIKDYVIGKPTPVLELRVGDDCLIDVSDTGFELVTFPSSRWLIGFEYESFHDKYLKIFDIRLEKIKKIKECVKQKNLRNN